MVKPEIKAKWVAALRSGEYTQGIGQLRDSSDRFCCLGVLCNLHAQAHPEVASLQRNTVGYMGEKSYLPVGVMEWAGITEYNPSVRRADGMKYCLSILNDAGVDFREIANYIEKSL